MEVEQLQILFQISVLLQLSEVKLGCERVLSLSRCFCLQLVLCSIVKAGF